jgi:hypothetical protein
MIKKEITILIFLLDKLGNGVRILTCLIYMFVVAYTSI